VIGAARLAGQLGQLKVAARSGSAREERVLAALSQIIAALREQGTAEEELFAAVVAALQGELAGEAGAEEKEA
jgi:hypothetical protein